MTSIVDYSQALGMSIAHLDNELLNAVDKSHDEFVDIIESPKFKKLLTEDSPEALTTLQNIRHLYIAMEFISVGGLLLTDIGRSLSCIDILIKDETIEAIKDLTKVVTEFIL